ncbi:bacillithiol biosynthesis cysteine-adding enzyme BshC [Gemmatimonadota bacterium]
MAEHGLQMVSSLVTTNRVAADYLAAKEEIRSFYGGHYTDRGRLKELAAKIDRTFDRSRAAKLLRQQQTFKKVKHAETRLERFIDKRGFIVTTGQQPVFFGGPIYILYKALTVIKLAEQAQEILEVPVLPVFWNAGEDHDLAEVASIKLPNLQGELKTLSFPVPDKSYSPSCLVTIGDEIDGLIGSLKELSPESEYRAGLLEMLVQGYRKEANLGAAFSSFLSDLLAEHGLFIVDSCSPAIREECRELLEAEIFDAASSIRAVKTASDRLAGAGYQLQITLSDVDTGLFMITDGEREKLQLGGSSEVFRMKRSGKEVTSAQLKELLDNQPATFSPGVLVRPLLEAGLLGTLCYVAGPGEIAYYAQMGDLYRLRNIEMPVIYPRLGGIIIESKIARILDKYGIGADKLRDGADSAVASLIAGHGPQVALLEELDSIRSQLEKDFARVSGLISGFDPTLAGPLHKTETSISGNLDRLTQKISAAANRQNQTMLGQLTRAAVQLWPEGLPQERQLASIYYLVRYGKDLIEFLLERVVPELQ